MRPRSHAPGLPLHIPNESRAREDASPALLNPQSVAGVPAAVRTQRIAGGNRRRRLTFRSVPGGFRGRLESGDEGLNDEARVAMNVVVGEEAASARLPVSLTGGLIGHSFDLQQLPKEDGHDLRGTAMSEDATHSET